MNSKTIQNQKKAGSKKRALFIIAPENYRQEEYEVPIDILEKGGIEIIVASSQGGLVKGYPAGTVQVDLILDEVDVNNYEAIVFIGGSGAAIYQENKKVHQIIQEALQKNKILAAICIAPTILAKAGVLRNKKATVWSSASDSSLVKILEENGVVYIDKDVVKDGNIITANGPGAAEEFGKKILEMVE